MLECFLSALSRVKNDVSRHMCLKQFTVMLIEHDNIKSIFDQSLLSKLVGNLFRFECEVTQGDEVSFTARKFYENYLFGRYTQID